jgi:Tol biopolymer transport system component/tRNA A-37 threonylcarbamoyl transferase component Bud32
MIGATILHYKIIEKLGEGGMGVVYLAEDTKLKRQVAIKFLPRHVSANEEERKRFEIEAQAAAALNHPNITQIYAIEEADEQLFIVMEYVEGRELKEVIYTPHTPPSRGNLDESPFEGGARRVGNVITIDQILEYAKQIAEGLQAAHKKGIVHRDIKSSNIMITDKNQVKIMDFGLAKVGQGMQLTKEQSTLGTAAYMSPEQIRGDKVDQRTDIWSFGVVLYEILTGDLPFKGEYAQAVMYAIVNDEVELVHTKGSGFFPKLEHAIKKSLSKSVTDRYQEIEEVLNDLKSLKALSSIQESEKSFPEKYLRSKYTNRYMLSALILMTIIILIIILIRYKFSLSYRESGFTAPVHITLKQITFSEDLEEYPNFSFDGKYLAYSREIEHYKHIFLKNLITGKETQLTEKKFDDIQPSFSPDGKSILFVRGNQNSGKLEPGDLYGAFFEGDIWKYNIETDRETKLIENAFNPAYSFDGRHIAFDASWAGPRRIWISDDHGRNPQQLSYNPSEAVYHIIPRWSPDNSKIVFQNIEKTKFNIFSVDVESQEIQEVTDDLYTNINPTWSSSGKMIYFSSDRSGGRNIWRVAVNPDGSAQGEPQQMTTGAGEDVQLAISPSAKKLAFSILKLNADLWKLPVLPETGEPLGEPQPMVVTTREDSRGDWSPDGTKIAFNSDRTGNMNIWIHLLKEDKDIQITEGSGGDYQPNWSADGKKLVFFSSRAGNADIWMVDVESKKLTQLTTQASLDMNPFFAPDGNKIAFQSDRDGRKELWVMNSNGSEQHRLTHEGCGGHFIRWSPDGNFIIYLGSLAGKWQILKIAVSGGDPIAFAEIKGGSHISFSPDHTKIMDVTGHNTLWTSPILSGSPKSIFSAVEIDFRIDYPVWSPDGHWVLFDRVKPQGGDIWILENIE